MRLCQMSKAAEWWRVGIFKTLFGSLGFKLNHLLLTPNCDKYVLCLPYFPSTLSAWTLWIFAMSNLHDSSHGIFSALINLLFPLPLLSYFCQSLSHTFLMLSASKFRLTFSLSRWSKLFISEKMVFICHISQYFSTSPQRVPVVISWPAVAVSEAEVYQSSPR